MSPESFSAFSWKYVLIASELPRQAFRAPGDQLVHSILARLNGTK